jgi:hypothetical protein
MIQRPNFPGAEPNSSLDIIKSQKAQAQLVADVPFLGIKWYKDRKVGG